MAERDYPFGWVDFSREDSRLAADIINALREQGAVDELGLGVIQSAFADRFFPGTSTIQTRAKYFFAVCYALREVFENTDRKNFASKLYTIEKDYSKAVYKNTSDEDKEGIFGTRFFDSDNKSWVRRPPSEVYWSGIKQFGFIRFDESKKGISLAEFIRILETESSADNGYIRQKGDEDEDCDRNDAEEKFWHWQLLQPENWQKSPTPALSEEEKSFFRQQIREKFSGTLLCTMLENGLPGEFKYANRLPLGAELEKLWQLANGFAEFIYPAQIYFNLLLQRRKSAEEWRGLQGTFQQRAEKVDIDGIFKILPAASPAALIRRKRTEKFLNDLKTLFLAEKLDEYALDELLTDREKYLKGVKRAKLCHREDFQNGGTMFSGEKLSFRFRVASTLLKDMGVKELEDVRP